MDKNIQTSVLPALLLSIFLATDMATPLAAQQQETSLKEQFNSYTAQTLQEKLYVHTDKNVYLAGESCWFKIYNADAIFNRPLGVSKLAYIELLDVNGKAVVQAKISLKNAGGNGSFQLPVTLGSGKYLLRAYTRWMKNFNASWFFEKMLTVINTGTLAGNNLVASLKPYDLQFFPEGGNMVYGIPGRVGFRVAGRDGKGIACSGFIEDEKGDTAARFSTLQFGLGSFWFTPLEGHSYKGVVLLPGRETITQALPSPMAAGYAMHLEKKDNGQLQIQVQSTAADASLPVYLLVHTRGSVKAVLANTLHQGKAVFMLDTARVGEGISHFTVFNAARQPVCERLFFKRPHCLEIKMTAAKVAFDTREKVQINIIAGTDGLPADMSMAVYRADALDIMDDADISSYMWLSSDFPGHIESPGYYCNSGNADADAAADNLMLTQGWRRFKWGNVLSGVPPTFAFAPEYRGHVVTGKVLDNNGHPLKGVESFLSAAGTKTQFRSTLSNDSGEVKFEMNDCYGSNELIAQVAQESPGHIELASPFANNNNKVLADLSASQLPETIAPDLLQHHVALQVQHAFNAGKTQQFLSAESDTTPFYYKPDNTYLLDDYTRFTTVEEILREYVSEVNVRRYNGQYFLPVFDNLRKEYFKMQPLILLDGVPVEADRIMHYDPLKIRKLEVVARTYFYGHMLFGGIINFITYQGDMQGFELDPRSIVVDYETLQLQRVFYAPVYETAAQVSGRMPDYRTVLYWQPAIATGPEGKAQVSFYTSDIPGRYAIVLQGRSGHGKTGSQTIYFQVNAHGGSAFQANPR